MQPPPVPSRGNNAEDGKIRGKKMKVIKKAFTPAGVPVQLESWADNFPELRRNYSVAIYPAAARDYGYFIKKGQPARVDFTFTEESAARVFLEMVSGETTPEKEISNAYNPAAAAEILGL
jgi:hypothetical protein